jgi:hypothetical protein
MRYQVDISARKEGAIGKHGTERRSYTVEAAHLEDVNKAAIDAAYREGGIEHVRITRVKMLDVADGLHNPNCDGGKCRTVIGDVRVYPLGAGGNLILCHACFAAENKHRYDRGRETKEPRDWPQVNWHTAKEYEPA